MQSTTEQWVPVAGYEGRYEVSDHGRVRSLPRKVWNGRAWANHPGRIMKTANGGHYPKVVLRDGEDGEKVYVHDLVLTHFVGPKPAGHYARHLDDVNTNNHLSNLEWGTPSDNSYDKVHNGNDYHAKREACKNGHEFTPENTARNPKRPGTRYCRECARMAQARRGGKIAEYKAEYAQRLASGHVPDRVNEKCKRGHLLEEPNLMPSQLPERQCLACSRGRASARRKNDPENLQAYTDSYYEKIMAK